MVYGRKLHMALFRCVRFMLLLQVAALRGYENANTIALDLWEEVYPSGLLFALTDTFSTDRFYKVEGFAHLVISNLQIRRISSSIRNVPAAGKVFGTIQAIHLHSPPVLRTFIKVWALITERNLLSSRTL
jgi:hypothetical protein